MPPPSKCSTVLRVERLEDRTTPAQFEVELLSTPMGTHGNSMGYVIGGGLHPNPAHHVANGRVYLTAASPQEAVRQAFVGSLLVDLSAVNKPNTSYAYNPATVGLDPAEHKAYLIAPLTTTTTPIPPPPGSPPAPPSPPDPAVTDLRIALEDLAAFAEADFDYDDNTHAVRVRQLAPPTAITVQSLVPGNPVAVPEGGAFGVRVQRAGGNINQPLAVPFAAGLITPNDWPATWQADYTVTGPGAAFNANGGTVFFAAGQTEVVLTVAAVSDAVPEVDEGLRLSVVATAGQPGYGQGVSVHVTDVAPPPVVENQSFTISKGLPADALVGTVWASTTDPRLTLTYSITAGNTGGAFAINSTDGTLTVANPAALAAASAFALTVQVADNSTPAQTDTAAIDMEMVDAPAPANPRDNTLDLNRLYDNIENYLNDGPIDNTPRPNGTSKGLNPDLPDAPTRKSLDLLTVINGHVNGMQVGLNFALAAPAGTPLGVRLAGYTAAEGLIALPMVNLFLKHLKVIEEADGLLQNAYAAVKASENDSFRIKGVRRQLQYMTAYLTQVKTAADAIYARLNSFAAPLDTLDLQVSLKDMPRRVYMANLQLNSDSLSRRINEVAEVLAKRADLDPAPDPIDDLNELSDDIDTENAKMVDTNPATELGQVAVITDELQRLMVAGVPATGLSSAYPGLLQPITDPADFCFVRDKYLDERDELVGDINDDPTDLANGYGEAGHVLLAADDLLDTVDRDGNDPGVLAQVKTIANTLGTPPPNPVPLEDKFRLWGIRADLEYLHGRVTAFQNEADTLLGHMATLHASLEADLELYLFNNGNRGTTVFVGEQYVFLIARIDERLTRINTQIADIANRMA